MKIACVTIVYHPDEKVLVNLGSYKSFPEVLVIDNSEEKSSLITQSVSAIPYIRYFHDGENKGIGARLNQACQLAIDAGCQWLLTMDQDSFFEPELLDHYIACVRSFPFSEDVAMFGIVYGNQTDSSRSCATKEVRQLITSGSLLNLDLFNKIGPFDEALFIDGVDTDYCMKSRLAGYRLVRFENIVLEHRIGLVSHHRSLKNGALTPRSLHSPVRLYYMTRNYLYLHRRYKSAFPADIREHRQDLLQRIKNNLLYGKNRVAVLKYIVRGIQAYYTGKMNKIN